VNVDVAAVVPAAAVKVTFTPLCQLPLLNVIDVGAAVIAVLPARVMVTVTLPVGAALSRKVAGPLAPPANVSEVGLAVIVG
jgi:hypothetical protein